MMELSVRNIDVCHCDRTETLVQSFRSVFEIDGLSARVETKGKESRQTGRCGLGKKIPIEKGKTTAKIQICIEFVGYPSFPGCWLIQLVMVNP